MKLLVDDLRTIKEADVTARSYSEGLDYLTSLLYHWDYLFIDHDLGEDRSGYDLINKCIELDVLPDCVIIVSDNPVGVGNIERALIQEGFRKIGVTEGMNPVWERRV